VVGTKGYVQSKISSFSAKLTISEISVIGHTSRPTGYIVRKYKDPSEETATFLPDEVYEDDFKHGGLGYEADAFARTLKGESDLAK
jgi:hypothetical protein